MPNWCYNRLCIDTTNESGKILADAFRPAKVDDEGRLYATPFEDLMPCPAELRNTEATASMSDQQTANKEKYGYADWYEWCWANWGVKWDARVEDYDDSDPENTYVYFETPWGAPIEFFRHFSIEYPHARYEDEYDEEGMQFEGKVGMSDVGFFAESWDMEENEDEFLDA